MRIRYRELRELEIDDGSRETAVLGDEYTPRPQQSRTERCVRWAWPVFCAILRTVLELLCLALAAVGRIARGVDRAGRYAESHSWVVAQLTPIATQPRQPQLLAAGAEPHPSELSDHQTATSTVIVPRLTP